MTLRTDKFDTNLAPFFTGEDLPRAWTAAHVALRLAEGFAWSAMERDDGEGLGCRTSWPPIPFEIDDLAAQQEQMQQEALQWVRMAPSAAQISRCDAALYWPLRYWAAHPQLAEAVNKVAAAHARDLDARWVPKKYGDCADDWRKRHDRGCEVIARGLLADGVSVF